MSHTPAGRERNKPQPREHLHDRQCLAHAVICAVENLRDQDEMTDHEMRLALQDNLALVMADDYLADGIAGCYCMTVPDPEPEGGVIEFKSPVWLNVETGEFSLREED